MNRRGILAAIATAVAMLPRRSSARVSVAGKQWSRRGFYIDDFVREQTIAKCASSNQKRKGKKVVVTRRCRELAGAGSGKSVTMRAFLYSEEGTQALDKCKGTFRTSGDVNRVHEVSCKIKLPKDAR